MQQGAGPGRRQLTLPAKESREIIRQALDAGVTFFDTANGYSAGSLDVELTDEDVAELEHPYRPHAVAGFE